MITWCTQRDDECFCLDRYVCRILHILELQNTLTCDDGLNYDLNDLHILHTWAPADSLFCEQDERGECLLYNDSRTCLGTFCDVC